MRGTDPLPEPIDPKREIVLDAALFVFAKDGIKQASMQKIAEKASMSRPALYLQFASKTDILIRLIARHSARWQAHLDAGLVAKTDPADALMAVCDRVVTEPLWQICRTQEALCPPDSLPHWSAARRRPPALRRSRQDSAARPGSSSPV